MADDVCLSIRFVPGVAEKVAAIVYSSQPDRAAQVDRAAWRCCMRSFAGHGFEVTTTGAATMCIRGSAERFEAAFRTAAPPDGWASQGFSVVDQRALDAVARPPARLHQEHRAAAIVRRHLRPSETGRRPRPQRLRLSLLGQVPALLGADTVHGKHFDGTGVRVMIFDSDFAFDHRFFLEREASCEERDAVATAGEGSGPNAPRGHGTAMAAIVLAIAPRAHVVGMRLRNGVLLRGPRCRARRGPRAAARTSCRSAW